jgi:glutaredoxin 3
MSPQNIRLFIKPGCPWCDEAIDWLAERKISYTTLDVNRDEAARREMRDLTGQTKAPSIEVDGEVLADFGADELEVWWKKKGFSA